MEFKLNNLFSKVKINTGRQYEVDLLRGFTLVILIICHVFLYLSVDPNSGLYIFADIIGSEPGAPVFMVLMGISVIFSRKQNALFFLKRGLILLIGGYLLNLVRSFPYWITGELDFFACVPGFFVVDIFQFAGLTFLLFALFKALKLPSWGVFIVSILFLIAGQILMAIPNALDFSSEASYFLNLFLPLENDWCCFNLLTWFIYPCFGLMLGELLIRCKNKKWFYIILFILGSLGVIALYLNIGLRFPNYTSYYFGNNFYRMGVLNTLITLLFSCFALASWYFIGKILPKFIGKYLSFLSKNITLFYTISWLIIVTLIHFQAYYSLEFIDIALVGMMFAVLISCSLLIIPYRKIESSIKNKVKQPKEVS